MATDFSELLSANRIRGLWSAGKQSLGSAEREKKSPPPDGSLPPSHEETPEGARREEALDDAHPEPLPQESSAQILDQVEQLMGAMLGPQALLFQVYLRPLKKALQHREESAPSPPLSAQAAARLRRLLYDLEDSLRGLLRVNERPRT